MSQNTERLDAIMTAAPVIPVLIIEDPKRAVPMAKALVRGGLKVLEITLRTAHALEAIDAIREHVSDAIVGAGTVLNAGQYADVVAAGSQFVVSPGATDALIDAAAHYDVPLLPGAATASEVMRLMERGYSRLKFFPAEQAGGAAYLKSLSSPLSAIKFCPTGGITPEKAKTYLGLPNVVCVGGSWVATADMIMAEEWEEIERLARAAAALER
ncbi:bifunctional 4-hydroxy-2-oxoglutarate aldolase/2-dehydro-3-deoxy-phosphogluconate aldolase [uncultured Roseibium sp.]|uniref:bifunctional 4-hydroxy-2-oxoglutarate aldolase/2-dehydro-3-deoxy-phosphogluconate aldolase n=1 Tax=uncultured Roseibium sp. TaxID=1936171 RepID=UPI0032178901